MGSGDKSSSIKSRGGASLWPRGCHLVEADHYFPGGPLPAVAGLAGPILGPGRSNVSRSNEARAPQPQRACALEPTLQLRKPPALETMLGNQRSHCDEKTTHHNQRKPVCSGGDPVQPEINKTLKKIFCF